jgi:Uma2 family endonuclease
MNAQAKPALSEEEYLLSERASAIKHEYYRGHIYAMAGAKEAHNLITANTLATLHSQLRRKPCKVYPNDMRIKVLRTGLNTYPDVVVICGQPQFTDATRDTLTNPTSIIEVLSSSTERYDRGLKFENYRMIDSLQEYLLIAQDHYHIEQYVRQANGQWLLTEATDLEETLDLTSIECTLRLEDVYEKVEIEYEDGEFPRELPPE